MSDMIALRKLVDEAHEWLTHNRQRLHHPICTVHKPDARCSCGLHKTMSGLAMVSHDLGALANGWPDPPEQSENDLARGQG